MSTTMRRTGVMAAVASVATLTVVVAFGVPRSADEVVVDPAPAAARAGEPSAAARGDDPLPWGPTARELAGARALVHGWSADRLAGQVIIGRFRGTTPDDAAIMVRDLHLAGVAVTHDNITDAETLRAMTRAVSDAVAADGRDFPAVIGVDEEGGDTNHLGDTATRMPAFADAGRAVEAGRPALVRAATRAQSLEMRGLGFTWVFAPVADVTIGPDDPTIGSRSASSDPQIAAKATSEAVRGFNEGGLVATVKHFPGHGSVTVDSHDEMPVQDASLEQLRTRDLVPFEAAVRAGARAVMMSHIDVLSMSPGEPASLASPAYSFLRERLGFEGVTLTDSLGMGAVTGTQRPTVRALLAGADLLLMPVDTATAHRSVVRAVEAGTISRERIEDAAAHVVAVQRWQARRADAVPVPEDAAEQAQAAAAALAAVG